MTQTVSPRSPGMPGIPRGPTMAGPMGPLSPWNTGGTSHPVPTLADSMHHTSHRTGDGGGNRGTYGFNHTLILNSMIDSSPINLHAECMVLKTDMKIDLIHIRGVLMIVLED